MNLLSLSFVVSVALGTCQAMISKEPDKSPWQDQETLMEIFCGEHNCVEKASDFEPAGGLPGPSDRFPGPIKRRDPSQLFRFRIEDPAQFRVADQLGFRYNDKRSSDRASSREESEGANPNGQSGEDCGDSCNEVKETRSVHSYGPLYRFTRVLRRDNDLGDDLMGDAGLNAEDLQGFRFRIGGRPDSFRFRVDKRDEKESDLLFNDNSSAEEDAASATDKRELSKKLSRMRDTLLQLKKKSKVPVRQTRNNYLTWRKITG